MNEPTKTWTEGIPVHLDLAIQVAKKLPANERLDVKDLNNILMQIEPLRNTFLFMRELHGFNLENKKKY